MSGIATRRDSPRSSPYVLKMRFWSFRAKTALSVIALPLIVAAAVATVTVCRVIEPERTLESAFDFEALKLTVEVVEFQSSDGLQIQGWILPGERSIPAVILCHGLGTTRDSLINLGFELNELGFPVMLFDFRAHGGSGGRRSTLGIKEKRDVIGAVDYLTRRGDIRSDAIGIYGVGMGAHAAVLAAQERTELSVLVLDGLYPDAAYPLVRSFYSGWRLGVDRLGFVPRGVFTVVNGTGARSQRAADVLPNLLGRDMLLLAPAGNAALASEIQVMYESVPEQVDSDGNLLLLPATQSEGLYGEHRDRHHDRVVKFFSGRLGSE